ncbi:SsgA family sporulation/cell division regulator [Dactylosporangium sp. NPDC000555]|uniref:SsgA family sporulation/cell division regulator n=1 Tax=Dactylosporangium sp. NPDC000555 TaxID=3154260 RepID=UPI0033330D88
MTSDLLAAEAYWTSTCRGPAVVEVSYAPRMDPYALQLAIAVTDGTNTWLISRDVVRDGLSEAAGYGDVHVTPVGNGRVAINLAPGDDTLMLLFDREELAAFVAATDAAVRPGSETALVDWDQLARQLAGA